ncbi:leucine--tRNA ligase [Candidatus Roseilinea sp. NK_OTU-006]|jgi:leucyl-tRNA synthetase|uniref:leucine--tRNA ligase n=1 Tax=Candidatus Roseilinea sp. NK_OTU-006 TaxID=2704250 RepID=UPI00145D9438|nr:leucine--tRNA ligase [Candidatus Roseilinea sp. NK_OTU-006]
MVDRYNPQEIEPKWQARWETDQLYKTEPACDKPKYYVLDFYPYPSGEGMSVGHARNYVPTDVIARYYRMKGYNVLHPMGFDAFGLPTENAAIKLKVDPHELNEKYSANYVRQYKLMGLSYDWSRLINSAHPDYYRWTQWIFIQMFNAWYDPRKDKACPIAELEAELAERGSQAIFDYIDAHPEHIGVVTKGAPVITAEGWRAMSRRQQNDYLNNFRLAFQAESTVNWDPVDKVVVADEEVEHGRAWRSGALVIKRTLKQWFFRITAYAERLINDLDSVDWPERIVLMQRNWIGKSEGAEVVFRVADSGHPIPIFTTRPDTLWGATFMVLSPEHPLAPEIATPEQRAEVERYIAFAKGETEEQRTAENKEKTGVFTGAYAINPVNDARIPIWIADYVLMSYGAGAIMAVPAHDQRDFEFARKFGLPIKVVVFPEAELKRQGIQDAQQITPALIAEYESRMTAAYEDKAGVMVNSGPLTGMHTGPDGKACIRAATEHCQRMGFGKRRVNYKIRPWLISRQRYWGTPIPIVHTPDGPVAMREDELPLLLPKVKEYQPGPNGESPLESIPEFVNAPNGRRETDTMATWACSSWYYIRFADPHNDKAIGDPKEIDYWLPVDMYVGGAEHAVLHLLYSRMWTKVLYDLGVVKFKEPFSALRNQGLILSPQKRVDEKGREYYEKMSKSKGNVITPDEVIAEHGADALRGYEMFISDFEQTVPWSTQGVPGVRRWLDRVWRIVLAPEEDKGAPVQMSARELRRVAHRTIQRYERDLKAFSFNTVVAAMMEFTNALYRARDAGLAGTPEWREAVDILLRLLAPIAPHMAEELWHRLGRPYSIHRQPFPVVDEAAARAEEITIVVQVNGKVRDRIVVPVDASEEAITQAALASEGARRFINGAPPRQVHYVKGRLVNIVV